MQDGKISSTKLVINEMGFVIGMIELKYLPGFDKGDCDQCGWVGELNSCRMEQEGDFEKDSHNFYNVYKCPSCLAALSNYWYSNKEDI